MGRESFSGCLKKAKIRVQVILFIIIMQTVPDIAECITQNLNQYFQDLDGQTACGVYDMVLFQVEKPLLQRIMQECDGNQCKAALMLGLNRNTLRKKLIQHGLLS